MSSRMKCNFINLVVKVTFQVAMFGPKQCSLKCNTINLVAKVTFQVAMFASRSTDPGRLELEIMHFDTGNATRTNGHL